MSPVPDGTPDETIQWMIQHNIFYLIMRQGKLFWPVSGGVSEKLLKKPKSSEPQPEETVVIDLKSVMAEELPTDEPDTEEPTDTESEPEPTDTEPEPSTPESESADEPEEGQERSLLVPAVEPATTPEKEVEPAPTTRPVPTKPAPESTTTPAPAPTSLPTEAAPSTTPLPGYLVNKTPDGFITIVEDGEELPKYFISYPSTLPGLMMLMVKQPTVEDAVQWLLEHHIYCIIITSDGYFFYPANGVPSEEDLLSTQPKPDGEKMEVVILNRLERYAPTSGPDTEKAPSTAAKVPEETPTVVTASFRVIVNSEGIPVIYSNKDPLPTRNIQWSLSTPGITWGLVPAATVEDAVFWLITHRVTQLILTPDMKYYYSVGKTLTEEDLTSLTPQPEDVQAELVDISPLTTHSVRWTIIYVNGYPQVEYTGDDGTKAPMETYYVQGDQPTGSLWQLVVLTSVSSKPENQLHLQVQHHWACRGWPSGWAIRRK
ncbi:hypothetical protein FJT64_020085 [Amphibalanus amphitrite]|uniref:Uncharacterized protein n=1 Tax=Amphibalanus amphitrite TaxID=1232801 RepID=A0A6A4WMZ4_AMPAM|nr:hypothetical protein FJT64_020085 [Amphibalanus amphitrite]